MAAPYNPPVKNQDFIVYIALADMANPGSFKANPTIAAGDFKVSKDGGAFTNLDTTPDVDPDAGVAVKVALTATEMNADSVVIAGIDQTTPKEWADFVMSIPTTSA
jgi:hypothetical protein